MASSKNTIFRLDEDDEFEFEISGEQVEIPSPNADKNKWRKNFIRKV